jgi:hypothetical protein
MRGRTGHVVGHFIRDSPIAGHAGHLPYLYVESADETLAKVTANGGTIMHVGRADLVILRCGLCAWARSLCSLYAPGLGGSWNFRQIMG